MCLPRTCLSVRFVEKQQRKLGEVLVCCVKQRNLSETQVSKDDLGYFVLCDGDL